MKKCFAIIMIIVCIGVIIILSAYAAASEDFQLDLTDLEIADTTAGKCIVLTENNDYDELYVRVTWVYEMDNGTSFAFCALKDVVSDEDGILRFKMVGPTAPPSCKLIAVQLALVTDPESDYSGTYVPLALAKQSVNRE